MGLLSWLKEHHEVRRRVLAEDALKHLHACQRQGRPATVDSLAGVLRRRPRRVVELCRRMEAQGWIRSAEGQLRLTVAGEQLGLQVIRAHRLWERYLADEARVPLSRLHAMADRREHRRDAELMQAMDAAMGHPQTDPHGDPIPTPQGALPPRISERLTDWPAGKPATIVHIEDEPAAVFSQIVAEGLRPGWRIRVIDSGPDRIVFTDENETYILAPVVAANIFVVEAAPATREPSAIALTELGVGRSATVWKLDETIQGYTRRRLLDLGLTPGATVTAEYRSFLGDPTAVRVRGTLVALRREQAAHVLIRANGDKAEMNHE